MPKHGQILTIFLDIFLTNWLRIKKKLEKNIIFCNYRQTLNCYLTLRQVELQQTFGWGFANITFAIKLNAVSFCNLYKYVFKVESGSENKGRVDDFLKQPHSTIKKLVALLDVLFSNSMIEAVNKIIKYDYLFWFRPRNFEHLEKMLPQVVHSYINRPHTKLYGYTPEEVLT